MNTNFNLLNVAEKTINEYMGIVKKLKQKIK